ncbi:ATP-binding protein [Kordiimonas laminariae]|uniref:ATP-binding protein n=1 Tax=Kordiimonas laminariae TaxID=2917717 RepID=UPI001FF6B8C1|nr:ATP-binding protein [Kordiimonas laminariae]MCK0069584.1 ATP-binding protein [Kordiimonas laminariae]
MTNTLISFAVKPVSQAELCGVAYDRFCADEELVAIPVVDKGMPVGLLKRVDFLSKLADRFGRPLFEAKPVSVLMDPNPVIVEDTFTLDILNKMMVEDESALRDGFIITENSFYKGIGTAAELLKANMARAEERMMALELAQMKAESAAQAKARFLANMSHELRTPLNAIIGFSELIMGKPKEEANSADVRGYIQDIHHSGKHLLGVINSILDMSKLEAGAFQLSEDYYSPDEISDQVMRIMEGMAWTKKISLTSSGFNNKDELLIDIQVFRQAVINLVSNAIKFSPDNATVRLEYNILPNSGVKISVIDNGPGMDPESLNKVMEPFVQVESGHNRRFEGSGLGLSLVKAFAEAHGGYFELKSRMGKGTKASIILPPHRCSHENVVTLAL